MTYHILTIDYSDVTSPYVQNSLYYVLAAMSVAFWYGSKKRS